MLVWKEPNYRPTSLFGILGVSGIRVFSVADHNDSQSLVIVLYLEVARSRDVHLFPLAY
jgi:hypothetical protein